MTNRVTAAACLLALAGAQREAPSIDALVAKASAYSARYGSDLGGLVAQEDYRQDLPQLRRQTRADFMLVKFSADGPWTPFRDVIEVDGKRVADREARLEKLFLSADPSAARENAERITRESSRYNLGRYYRSTNIPVIGLAYLEPEAVPRTRFHGLRRETIDGEKTWRVDFEEPPDRTVVRDGTGGPLPAQGTIWIREADGAVLRTLVRLSAESLRSFTDVRFCAAPSIAVLVPCRMEEWHMVGGDRITGVAIYTQIRQFKVATSESIKH